MMVILPESEKLECWNQAVKAQHMVSFEGLPSQVHLGLTCNLAFVDKEYNIVC